MGVFGRIFGGRDANRAYAPLYAAVVAEARRREWYADGGVPDTLDGRFDMVSTILSLVLLRLDAEGVPGREPAARLTELFVSDMDGQLRQEGIGDVVVGKHIGRMMSQLGGRLTAYRDGFAPGGELAAALDRNVHRGATVPPAERAYLERGVRGLAERLARCDLATLLRGSLA